MSSPLSCSRAAHRSIDSASGVLEPPLRLDLLQQAYGGGFDAVGLQRVDVVALLHGADAAHPGILVGESAHQIVKQSLAHRAFGDAHAVDAEILDNFQEYRETRRKHRRTRGVDVLEIEVIDVSRRDHALGQRSQMIERDARRIRIQLAHHVADHADRSRAAEGLQPAELAVGLRDRLELQPDGGAGPLEALFGDAAVVEKARGQPHASHRQALEQQRIEALADDDFGGAAADVDHQALVRAHGAGVRHARIDQPRLLQSRDDLDRVSERRARAFEEPALALRPAQRAGPDHANAVGAHGPQPLTEALETAQRALGGRIVEPAAVVEAGGQPHHLAQPVQNDQLAVRVARDHHVKTVGAQIYRGKDVGNDTTPAHLAVVSGGARQAENEDPHPQVVLAFGFRMTNCAPCRSSL